MNTLTSNTRQNNKTTPPADNLWFRFYFSRFYLISQSYNFVLHLWILYDPLVYGGRRGGDCMIVWFTTTYAISAYHHWCCESEFRSGRGMHHYVGQWLATVRWFSPGPPVSSAVVKAATTRKQIKNEQIYGFLALLCLLRTPVLFCTLQQQIHRL
jgi:hypothetical protein